ncbi:hypothetical protein SAMN06295912_11643 [Sphingomonas laterariae]|uniref:Uncharacterized protein n=1 Tax=Edaphosphingomonas laterariae TaxID=861865 RepID=A0A239HDB6_9SPHN|nr:hypothetical protein [Sphingomonas laterariae]SNS79018.1 hypothetical protein SAMN06295912_11643 [Sphingomonas laterariae]
MPLGEWMAKARSWTWQDVFNAALAVALAPVAIPVALIVRLTERPMDRSPEEVAHYLRLALNHAAGIEERPPEAWDWADFTGIRIADRELEEIRARAARLRLPLGEEAAMELRFLLARAERAARRGHPERFDS